MQIEYAFLASAAEWTEDGRLQVINGDLERVQVSVPGSLVSPVYLVGKLVGVPAGPDEAQELRVELRGPSGQVLEQATASIVGAGPGQLSSGKVGFIHRFLGTPVPEAGTYVVRILVGGRERKALSLAVEGGGATQVNPRVLRLASDVVARAPRSPLKDMARLARFGWLEEMGVQPEEARSYCTDDVEPPLDLETERKETEALARLKQAAPSYEGLLRWAGAPPSTE